MSFFPTAGRDMVRIMGCSHVRTDDCQSVGGAEVDLIDMETGC